MQRAELIRTPINSGFTPGQALLALRGDPRPFALTGRWAGGGAILGSRPARVAAPTEDPLALLDQVPAVGESSEGVGGGWFGYLGYGIGEVVEDVPPPPPRPLPLAVVGLAYYDHVLRQDAAGTWWFEGLDDGTNSAGLNDRLDDLRTRLEGDPAEPRAFDCGEFKPTPGSAGYQRAVEVCLGYIEAGDLYQANLALRLEASFSGLALDLFAQASTELEPAYGAYLDTGEAEIASLSPELFLRRRGRRVTSAPIKGTRRRPADTVAAEELSRELASSEKDHAENVMIVDLMRNDLGRVCRFGSVEAGLATVPEAHPGLWHLVSVVNGTLRDGVTDGEILRATFPPGSVTGAPKIMAQEVISTLEGTGREVYTGAIGFTSPVAGLELNVAIRTFEVSSGRIWLGVGAGIVADSDPAAEYAETLAKAEPLVRAAGSGIPAERDDAEPRPRGPSPVRVPRPDPAFGIIETLLSVDGVSMELNGHLDRMLESSRDLYGVAPERDDLAREVGRQAPGDGRHRIRLALVPGRGGLGLSGRSFPVSTSPDPGPVILRPITVPGGLGRHKWADRRLVDSVAAAPGHEALICEIDATALESGAGNVWIVEGDALVTPPADGRILPGATRAALIALADEIGIEFLEETLTLERLEAADDVFVTSSVRGIHRALLAGADDRSGASAVREMLGEALRARWAGRPPSVPAL